MQLLDHRQATGTDRSGALTPRLPDSFSLGDVNPLTGQRYCESRYSMLPRSRWPRLGSPTPP
jgi:hypothetical protein